MGEAICRKPNFYIRKVLAIRPKNLKLIFIEYTDKLDAREENVRATREVYWHTLGETLYINQVILASKHEWSDKLIMIFDHIHSYFYGIAKNGKGSAFIQSLIGYRDNNEGHISLLGESKDIYISYDEDPPGILSSGGALRGGFSGTSAMVPLVSGRDPMVTYICRSGVLINFLLGLFDLDFLPDE
ncbi:hypothetical protein [Trichothermofontia sp.]